jgi:hypothetical protein
MVATVSIEGDILDAVNVKADICTRAAACMTLEMVAFAYRSDPHSIGALSSGVDFKCLVQTGGHTKEDSEWPRQ